MTIEQYENEIAALTALLADGRRGSIGPLDDPDRLWALVGAACGIKLPPSIVKVQLQRIGLEPEQREDGWYLNLGRAAELIALAWDDEEPLRSHASEEEDDGILD